MHFAIITLYVLVGAITHVDASYASSILAIKDTINRYPLALDLKNFQGLSNVFTPNGSADYGPPIGVLTGVATIESTLSNFLMPFRTQHTLSTHIVTHLDETAANATTYWTAYHFGVDGSDYAGQMLTAYGRYEDQLLFTNEGWRIGVRKAIYMGPIVYGNGTLVALPG